MKTKNLIPAVLFLLLLQVSFVSADVIIENTHPVNRCVTIANLDEFPGIYLIGFVTGPGVNDLVDRYIIKQAECLTKGYKFNNLEIFAAEKSYIDSVGIDNIKVEKVEIPGECEGGCYSESVADDNLFRINNSINPYGGYVDDSNHLAKEDIEYSIIKSSDGKYLLYMSKRVSEYNNGNAAKTEIFEKPNPETLQPGSENLEPHRAVGKGIFGQILCFFSRLFGGSC